MPIDRAAYLREMDVLITKAAERWSTLERPPAIFAVAIWTDPQARASAFNVETRRHSDEFVGKRKAWGAKERKKLLAEGDVEMADLFLRDLELTRNTNPADFEFPILSKVRHRSFDAQWAESTTCWRTLAPLLVQVRDRAARHLLSMKLEPMAEIATNSRASWYDKVVRIGTSPTEQTAS